ncbi:hypothetical protein K1719_016593 [Acacia pycnantha]|nr:hypothetical protein K1719_016593 [Acacia pycnantha]
MRYSNLNLLAVFFIISTLSCICLARTTPQDFLKFHNEARAEVGVGPLSWNNTLASYAKKYANMRSQDCKLEHSDGPFGENIAEGYKDMKGSDAVKLWLTEKPNYNYDSNTCANDECLHYTQIVWRDSHHLGCARAKCPNDGVFVICSYDPPGNFIGRRPY